MNLAHLLEKRAVSAPERPAIFRGAKCTATYGEWAARAARVGGALRAKGLVEGDRVAVFMKNHPRYLEFLFGIWWAGLVAVPVNAKLHVREAEWIVGTAKARVAFVTKDTVSRAGELGEGVEIVDADGGRADGMLNSGPALPAVTERAGGDPAWLFFTSGTTGKPKGAVLTNRNLMTMGLGYFADVDHIAPGDAHAYAAPMSHGAGIYAIPHVMAGARHVVPESGGFDAAELFELGMQVGPLSMFAAPTIVKRLVDEAEARGHTPERCARSFKTIVYGGAPMYVADITRALRVMGPLFVQIFGQGETPMSGTVLSRQLLSDTSHPRYLDRLASVGVAQTTVRIRVADPKGRDLPPGEIGEVLVAGDTVMGGGYLDNPAATASAIRDGWLWTGDMGFLDGDGFLTLKDRSKDVLISGGSNIYPREVEEALLAAPGVAEVSVIGAPDPEWGEVVVAFVVPSAGAALAADALDAHCIANIARFKRPKRYVFVDALPKNNYGKVLKTELRQRIAEEGAIKTKL
ncbi:AMP-dependent synthetase and ligase [Hyaloraphidium curvatum]|nr:AMP-dependent synthetase and ligase [Hyaloraphidium curvatum]